MRHHKLIWSFPRPGCRKETKLLSQTYGGPWPDRQAENPGTLRVGVRQRDPAPKQCHDLPPEEPLSYGLCGRFLLSGCSRGAGGEEESLLVRGARRGFSISALTYPGCLDGWQALGHDLSFSTPLAFYLVTYITIVRLQGWRNLHHTPRFGY